MTSTRCEAQFDVLTTTADELRQQLEAGTITSVEIINTYLSQISKHNKRGAKCNAIIHTPQPCQLLAQAAKLDVERAAGNLRGPLHGIPILLKDSIATAVELGLPTTAGSQALITSSPPRNATLVDSLLNAGMIILGKTNMTEFLGKKGVAGWSAAGGMCQPAYIASGYKFGEKRRGETVINMTPAGSSTGSAVGVACGFGPLAMGTETTGSIVSPSAVAALYALKTTPGSVSLNGVFHLTSCFDTVGAMGKTPLDIALACDAFGPWKGIESLTSATKNVNLKDISVGFLDIEQWRLPEDTQVQDPKYFEQTAREYAAAKKMLRDHGAKVEEVYIIPPEEYMVKDMNIDDLMDQIINRQSKNGFDRYLKDLQYSEVRTLEEIVQFNDNHPDLEFDENLCPNQNNLHRLVEMSQPDEDVEPLLEHCEKWTATEGVDKVMKEHGVDVVVCCSDSFFAGVSVAARYPMASMPLGYIESSGRPYGLQAVAPKNQEASLVKFMTAWESVMPPRRLPDLEACEKARSHL